MPKPLHGFKQILYQARVLHKLWLIRVDYMVKNKVAFRIRVFPREY